MTVAAIDIERPSILGGVRDGDHRAGGEPTLDDLLVGTCEGLAAHRTVTCPVCSGAMAPRYGAGATVVGGRCRDCDSTLG